MKAVLTFVWVCLLGVAVAQTTKKPVTKPASKQSAKSTAKTQPKPAPKPMADVCKNPISQGVTGRVLFYEGNQMPDPRKPFQERGVGVRRKILIVEPAKVGQSEQYREFIIKLNGGKPVKEVYSDDQGCFKVALNPGKYSLLIMEDGRMYANVFDSEGYICPITVEKGKLTKMDLRITYKAFF